MGTEKINLLHMNRDRILKYCEYGKNIYWNTRDKYTILINCFIVLFGFGELF